jgi:hypothetical protein
MKINIVPMNRMIWVLALLKIVEGIEYRVAGTSPGIYYNSEAGRMINKQRDYTRRWMYDYKGIKHESI